MNHVKVGVVFGLVWLIGSAHLLYAQTAVSQEEKSDRILSQLAHAPYA